MKKLIFTAVMFLGLTTLTFAQKGNHEKRTPEQRAEKMTAGLAKKLSLTEDQKSRIYAINLEDAKKGHQKHEKGSKGQSGNRESMMKEHDERISAVLNSSQRKTYQDWKVKRESKMKDHKGKKGDKAKK